MTNQQPTGGFAKAFVPGLVLGIVIGAFAGATLPAMLATNKMPEPTGVTANGTRTDRDREVVPDDALPDPELDATDEPLLNDDTGAPGEEAVDSDDPAPPDGDATSESSEDDGGG